MILEQKILENPKKYGYGKIEANSRIMKNSIAIYSNFPDENQIYTCYYVFTPEDEFQREGIAITFSLDKVITTNEVNKFV